MAGKMQYTNLGSSGLRVPKIVLGGASFGSKKSIEWAMEEDDAITIIKKCYDAGINFFDTADSYSNGESERIFGKAIKQLNLPRENLLIATKLAPFVHPMDPSFKGWFHTRQSIEQDHYFVNQQDLSRKHIFNAVERSLKNLGVDYIDLYQIHRFDYDTPVEETMEALHDLVKMGKVRYIGGSSMFAWQFAKMNFVADKHGWTKFISMQNQYNLLYREEEREMNKYCVDAAIALIPWAPLAGGKLMGQNRNTERAKSVTKIYGDFTEEDSVIIDRCAEVAQRKGVPPSQVGLAWLFSRPNVNATVVGITKEKYLDDAIAALVRRGFRALHLHTMAPNKMEYVRLGNSGLKVSKICVGCMSYGSKKWQDWVLEEKEAIDLIKKCYDAGLNFFDTANIYSNGVSEVILGNAIKQHNIPRENIVVATKAFGFTHKSDPGFRYMNQPEPLETKHYFVNQKGLSRKNLFEAVDASLERLGLDYIDLYQIHRFDPETPIEETMEALHDIVKSGKVRYIGASSMWAWQFAKMNFVAEKNGWTKFISMQNHYSLMYREEEREMNAYCLDAGVGLIPWGPLAGGKLMGKNRDTARGKTQAQVYPNFTEADEAIIDRAAELGQKKGVPASQIALAWILSKPAVSAPIVGMGKEQYLEDAIASLSVELSEEDIKYLEDPYVPKNILGHQ
ncbi:hypothetical protein BZG36_00418 [Bifiguratus adelaidae]|uniref:NADP-dependent oxidoreductase domain-containing protein n=1 Tax=Bifiguratus adelaidae TaxID=1938954 RepID=A0A261Y828_9FUNG|nr:hypothetical protein BZG36_00418 [Bifiguratus adelaidae]